MYIKNRPSLCSRMYRFVGNISLTSDSSLLKVGCFVVLPNDLLSKRLGKKYVFPTAGPMPWQRLEPPVQSSQSQDTDFCFFSFAFIYIQFIVSCLMILIYQQLLKEEWRIR